MAEGRGRKKWSSLEPLHSNFDSNSQTSCTAAKTGTPSRVLSARRRAKRGSWERHTHPYRYNKSYLYRNELLEMRAARYIYSIQRQERAKFLVVSPRLPRSAAINQHELLVIILNNNKFRRKYHQSTNGVSENGECLFWGEEAAARRECII
jgi:hypothetical protein